MRVLKSHTSAPPIAEPRARTKRNSAMSFSPEDCFEEVNKKGSNGASGGSGDGRFLWWRRCKRFPRTPRDRCRRDALSRCGLHIIECDARVERHHRAEQAGAAKLTIDDTRIEHAVPHELARLVLIRTGPEIGRRQSARGIAEPVILLKQRQRAARAPIGPARGMRS